MGTIESNRVRVVSNEHSDRSQTALSSAPLHLSETGRSFAPAGQGKAALAPVIASYILAACLALIVGRIFWLIAAPLPTPYVDADLPLVGTESPAEPVSVKAPFREQNIAAVETEVVRAVEETSLNLKLKGVWAEQTQPSAIILLPDGKERRFEPGDEILPGVALEAVRSDHIAIRRNGVTEALYFENKLAVSGARPLTGNANRSLARDATNEMVVSDFLRLAPGRDANGQLVIELYAARDRSTFQAFGLKDGDQLIAVNGALAPTSPDALASVIDALQRSSSAALVVKRGETEVPITIPLASHGK